MHQETAVLTEPGKQLLEPDTFWDLIENLLLHSTTDEQCRVRHNASLSALCRGHALSQLPREKAPRPVKTGTIISKASKKTNLKVPKAPKTNTDKKWQKNKERELVEGNKRDVNAQQTRSECNVSDSDIVFVKDSDIPASERLWRFAIRNRKQKQLDGESREVSPKLIPRVRSNEAIFEGLKKRLENAKDNEPVTNVNGGKSKQKPKKERQKHGQIRKHQCKNVTNNYSFVNNKVLDKKSESRTTSTTKSPEQAVPKEETNDEQGAHDLDPSPVQNLIKTSESEFQYSRTVSPEHFETKKNLYDSVLKKRLTCGNQLEVLNREIINKKLNPRLVLSRETTKKYTELKTNYLHLCYQESSLRHQIAMLQAEIYTMQNKGLHKRLAAVKTITLDSKSARLPHVKNSSDAERYEDANHHDKVLLFPRLKPPRPLIIAPQKQIYYNNDHFMPTRKSTYQKESPFPSGKISNENCASTSFPRILDNMSPKGICSLYSLTTALKSSTPRAPAVLLVPPKVEMEKGQTVHRLPKMNIAIKTKD